MQHICHTFSLINSFLQGYCLSQKILHTIDFKWILGDTNYLFRCYKSKDLFNTIKDLIFIPARPWNNSYVLPWQIFSLVGTPHPRCLGLATVSSSLYLSCIYRQRQLRMEQKQKSKNTLNFIMFLDDGRNLYSKYPVFLYFSPEYPVLSGPENDIS